MAALSKASIMPPITLIRLSPSADTSSVLDTSSMPIDSLPSKRADVRVSLALFVANSERRDERHAAAPPRCWSRPCRPSCKARSFVLSKSRYASLITVATVLAFEYLIVIQLRDAGLLRIDRFRDIVEFDELLDRLQLFGIGALHEDRVRVDVRDEPQRTPFREPPIVSFRR